MYASNRYDKELVRVPKNYGGNAFSSRYQEDGREGGNEPAAPSEHTQPTPPTDAPEGTPREEPIDLPPLAQSEEAAQPQGHPSGIGQEELLLLSLLLLLRGEGTAAEAGEAQELRWMLMLLLLLG